MTISLGDFEVMPTVATPDHHASGALLPIAQYGARVDTRHGVANVALAGEFDLAAVPTIERAVMRAQTEGAGATMIDLRAVTFLDCSTLGALVAANSQARARQERLLIVGVGPKLRRLFELTGTQQLLDHANTADVVAQFNDGAQSIRTVKLGMAAE